MRYRHVRVLGGAGSGVEPFTGTLRSIRVDRHDRVHAAGDSQIKVFDPGGRLERQWSTSKPALCVAISPGGSVFAGQAGQIEIFDGTGRLSATWSDEARLAEVTSIGFAGDSVLAGDVKGRCIRRFDSRGSYLNDIGNAGRMRGLQIPNRTVDFGVDGRGIIHAANPGKHRVERYTLEGELLGHVGYFDGIAPTGFGGCCNPTNVAVGAAGRLYVTEKADARAKVLDADGSLVAVLATTLFDPMCKNMPVAVDSRGRVFVGDTVKLVIHVFEPEAAS